MNEILLAVRNVLKAYHASPYPGDPLGPAILKLWEAYTKNVEQPKQPPDVPPRFEMCVGGDRTHGGNSDAE